MSTADTEPSPSTSSPDASPTSTATLPAGVLLVANKQAATLTVFDLPERTPVATLSTGVGPHEIAVSDDGAWAVVSDYGEQQPGHTLTVVDLKTRAIARTIDLGEHHRPHGSRFLPGAHTMVVTTEASQRLLVVDVDRGTVNAAIPTEQAASHMVVLDDRGSRAYTANIVAGTVSELDLASRKHLRTIAVAPMIEAIALAPDGRSLWVGSNAQHTVSIVDLGTGKVTQTLEAPGLPIRVEMTPRGQRAVVSAAESGALHVFDVGERALERSIDIPLGTTSALPPGPGDSPVPIGVVPVDEGLAFVSLARTSEVAFVDLERGVVVERLPVGLGPDGLAFVPEP